ncbi:MAG TPA: aromatic amino acid ammonia-lyase [Xanthomonadaceae bacterium]|nr:aromatic amino acid ammonia-lyase [Xanthomonadaceae bacterium]
MRVMLDGRSLTRKQVIDLARGGASIALDAAQLVVVQRAADFLAAQVEAGEPIYGVTTGFGSNADRLLGRRHIRAALDPTISEGRPAPAEELQRNLIVSHAVCVGEPLAEDLVRAMMAIRINTLMRGHSGIRAATLTRFADIFNAGLVPVVPAKGSVGASGDLAPLSHLALLLLGEGEAFLQGQRLPGAQALAAVGLAPMELGVKEGLALNNGTTQMLASGCLAIADLEDLLDAADLAAALTIEAFAGRRSAFDARVHALRPHPGQQTTAANLRRMLAGSTLADIDYHRVPRFASWTPEAWWTPELQALTFDIRWGWVRPAEREGREAFYERHLPFRGGKKHQPQDSYSLRCVPQVHGAVRDACRRAAEAIDIELNAVTDNPIIFPEAEGVDAQVISAGNFHGMPLALAMAQLKSAIPVLASISERRLNKLVDPATSDGLPPFLVGNEDATDSGLMIVQYTAAALVNDLASRAHPASVFSIPTSANAEDHVSMGTNEARHVLEMLGDLRTVLALELFTACQGIELRQAMINAARAAGQAGPTQLAAKVDGAPEPGTALRPAFEADVARLAEDLAALPEIGPGPVAAAVLKSLRRAGVAFLERDRALDLDIRTVCAWMARGEPLGIL